MRRTLRQAIRISGRKRTWLMERKIYGEIEKDNFQAQKGQDQEGKVKKAEDRKD